MEKFELTVLGCGSALPTTRHSGAAQVLNIREKYFLIDCAECTQLQMRKYHVKFSQINNIFISHLHGDHVFGLIGFISTLALLGRNRTLNIYGPKDTEALFRPQLNYFCNGIDFSINIHEVDTSAHTLIYEDKSVEVYTIPLKHRIKCCGYLFKEKPLFPHIKRDLIDAYNIPVCYINNIKAGMDWITEDGEVIPNNILTTPADPTRSFAYCSDTMFLPQNAELLQGVDLLYHEATFAEQDKNRCHHTFHSTAKQAAEMARLSNAKRLLIGHYSSRYEDERILQNEAKEVFDNTLLAYEGLCIRL